MAIVQASRRVSSKWRLSRGRDGWTAANEQVVKEGNAISMQIKPVSADNNIDANLLQSSVG
jgi:hypothetical protein